MELYKMTLKCALDGAKISFIFEAIQGASLEASIESFLQAVGFCDDFTELSVKPASVTASQRYNKAVALGSSVFDASSYALGKITMADIKAGLYVHLIAL